MADERSTLNSPPLPRGVVAQRTLVNPEGAALFERVKVEPPPAWVIPQEVPAALAASAKAPAFLLLDEQHHAAQHARYVRIVRRLETIQAVHEVSEWRVDLDTSTERLALHSLKVSRGSVEREHATAERLRILRREESLERSAGDGAVTAALLIADVQVGDVVDASFTVFTSPRLFAEHTWLLRSIAPLEPLASFHLSVCFPTGVGMRWKSHQPAFAPAVREHAGETTWSWRRENVPAVDPEPALPSWVFSDVWVQVSDFGSWAEVAAAAMAAWGEALADPALVDAAEEIAQTAATPALRAERVLTLVQDEIRLSGARARLDGQLPAAPGAVLERRSGDVLDKTFLAVMLLRRLGISARAVWVHTAWRQAIEQFLPTPAAFNHALVEYEVEGKHRWVDVTVPLQGGSALSRPVVDYRLGLPLGTDVERLEHLSSIVTDARDHLELRETYFMDTAGRPSSLKVQVTATGSEADTLRRSLALEGASAVAKKRERFYQQMYPELQRVGTLEWRDDRARNRLLIAEVFDLPGALSPIENSPNFLFQPRAHLIESVLAFPEASKRRHPLALRYPCDYTHWIEVESPGLAGGENWKLGGKYSAFRFECEGTWKAGRIAVSFALRTLADFVKAEGFDLHKAKVRELWPAMHLRITLASGATMPWQKRSSGNLLPTTLTAPNRQAHHAPAASGLPPASALPVVPAPPLSTQVRTRGLEAAAAELLAGADRSRKVAVPEMEGEEGASGGRSRKSRRKRHQHQKNTGDNRGWILLVCVAVALTVIVIFVMSNALSERRAAPPPTVFAKDLEELRKIPAKEDEPPPKKERGVLEPTILEPPPVPAAPAEREPSLMEPQREPSLLEPQRQPNLLEPSLPQEKALEERLRLKD